MLVCTCQCSQDAAVAASCASSRCFPRRTGLRAEAAPEQTSGGKAAPPARSALSQGGKPPCSPPLSPFLPSIAALLLSSACPPTPPACVNISLCDKGAEGAGWLVFGVCWRLILGHIQPLLPSSGFILAPLALPLQRVTSGFFVAQTSEPHRTCVCSPASFCVFLHTCFSRRVCVCALRRVCVRSGAPSGCVGAASPQEGRLQDRWSGRDGCLQDAVLMTLPRDVSHLQQRS